MKGYLKHSRDINIGTDLLATTQEVAENHKTFEFQRMTDPSLPTIIVPARLNSSRFPRKLLANLAGKPLVVRTAERIRQEAPEFDLFFAVDGDELSQVLTQNGFHCVLTDPALPSGTDRIAHANKQLLRKKVINVQADEPMVSRTHILSLAKALDQEGADLSTLAVAFSREIDFQDPNQVKVVRDNSGFALYFSRSAIPYDRDGQGFMAASSFKHLGLYAYKDSFLQKFLSSPQGTLEKLEKLEQLRALEMGCLISVGIVEEETKGVDIPEDLQALDNSSFF